MTTVIANSSSTRKALDKALRSGLERTVIKARDIAEEAAMQALKRHAVGDKQAPDYFTEEQRALRNRLRAHGRQLGDVRYDNGEQTIHKLVTEVAYEHWHRMLFARFLEQNGLLMYDQHTSVTLQDCNELIEEGVFQDELEQACSNGWELAGVLASKMLPQIFRTDSPVFQLQFALELQRELEALVMGLAPEVFQAQDSLGWVYQFWQSKRKEEVNKSEVKIGADELSPVTQLFTEPYMVSFLLDNSLGAWWAGKRLSDHDWIEAQSEQELRDKAAIAGVPLEYLRFAKEDDRWQPASGVFEGWPSQLSELKTLDPCCGSGHFLVAAFLMLVPMRMELEEFSAKEAVDRVLEENLHGLELDQRCVELAAFAVALEAWRYPNAGGYRTLPELHLACSGLSISAAKDEWKELSKKAGKQNLTIALDWMYQTFKDAPVLGSLINPKRLQAAKIAQWDELDTVLTDILTEDERIQAETGSDVRQLSEEREAGIVAQGLSKSVRLLSKQYELVLTNVPFLGHLKFSETLKKFILDYYPSAKSDLALVMFKRCHEFLSTNGRACVVMPQGWLVQSQESRFRKEVLKSIYIKSIVNLGGNAFSTPIGAEVLLSISEQLDFSDTKDAIKYCDLSGSAKMREKISTINHTAFEFFSYKSIKNTKEQIIGLKEQKTASNLGDYAYALQGLSTGEKNRFERCVWELPNQQLGWDFLHETTNENSHFGGRAALILWEDERGDLARMADSLKHLNHAVQSWRRGKPYWNKPGIAINRVGSLNRTIYTGEKFSADIGVISPKKQTDLVPLYCFVNSEGFIQLVRRLYKKREVPPSYLVNIPIDIVYWRSVSDLNYPVGLPKPYSNDPSQWVFHGHPCGSVDWDEEQKWTVELDLRVDDTVLQVAVARLLGYQWPAELDAEMELADEQRAWVERCKALAPFVDDDGIVCLPAVRGEKAAELRLEAMLEAAYCDAWTTNLRNQLLDTVGSKSLSAWLRDKFFEQHCKLFQHRPFIWQIWDGLKDGFSVLVNYHKLDKAGLERLIYTYLGDWIRTQQAEVASGVDGADIRLAAAQTLKKELENILTGEKPHDIFVRWKPLEEQPIGWNPDLNDGVRLNIRPFMLAKDMGKKGAGVLRAKPNIKWTKDRGTDVESAPWYHLGPEYGEKFGARINEHHLSLETKRKATESSNE
ncbi:BREX-1 system adenine-specific DNA-methyltransferase PglX [Pseudidiomarina homiensis]|uniref:BREX-1 system adenine-specific DNA-methyltransferase PglX n=1 Tax=Pseudidiomarina homiensis TaxID=364198 RepID=UPI00215AC176|nr:BREX-1 system adenine-specific DNA-methyltransferase PglX [Pseudidiomarina homiensis]